MMPVPSPTSTPKPNTPERTPVIPPQDLPKPNLAAPGQHTSKPQMPPTLPWSTRTSSSALNYTSLDTSTALSSHRRVLSWPEIVAEMRLPRLDTSTIAEGQGEITFHNLRSTGRGGFGQVYRASVAGDDGYALKRQIINADSKNLQEYLKKQMRELNGFRREAKIYSSPTLNSGQTAHLALLSDIAFVTHHNADGSVIKEPLLAMEWANAQPDNTLQAWMDSNPVSEHSIQDRLSFAIQMFSGLVELHFGKASAALLEESTGLFVHQDLKPANMLLFGNGPGGSGPFRLAITDFGLSVCYNGTDAEATCGGGTHLYLAPEQWSSLGARTPERDIWAAAMVVAKLFAGPCLKKAIHDYKVFCQRGHKRCCAKITQEICNRAENFAPAIAKDGEQKPVSQLSSVQQAVAQLLQRCFRQGRELGGAIIPGNARLTSLQCEELLKNIWQDTLGFQSWHLYHDRLPGPKPTPLQKYSSHNRANLYFQQMEIGMLTMMLRQCERLRDKVEYRVNHFVDEQIWDLRQQIRRAEEQAKSHRKKAGQQVLAAAAHHRVSFDLVYEKCDFSRSVHGFGGCTGA